MDAGTTNRQAIPEDAIQALTGEVRGNVLLPSDETYDDARSVWNGMFDRHPPLIAQCSGTADVVSAVNFAREHDLTVAIKGGGHSVAGHSVADDALLVDLSLMNGVFVDPVARTVRVQGGATWGDVDRETQLHGLATPGGLVSTTGVAGLTLHGGFGHLRRKYGLSVDNVRSVEIVTADGRVHTANERTNQDLFWAVRGAGSNFGVVTSFEFQLHPVGPEIFLCAPCFAAEDAPQILTAWRDFMAAAPEEITSILIFWNIPPGFPEELVGRAIVVPAAVYAGSPEDGERLTQPLRELAKPVIDLSARQPYTQVQSSFDPFFAAGNLYYYKSLYVNQISDEMIDPLCDLGSRRQSPRSILAIWHNEGGEHQRVSDDAMAFTGRGSNYMLSFDAAWFDAADSEANIAWARQGWDQMQRYGNGGLYANFPGFEGEDRSLVRAGYGPNYERLSRLKAQYDPGNLFRHNQNINPVSAQPTGI